MRTSVFDYLLFIFSQFDRGAGSGAMVYLPYQTFYQIATPYAYHESTIRHALTQLEKRNYTERLRRNNFILVSPTSAGINYLKNKYPIGDTSSSNTPSGWWLVVFNVPELQREIRDQLRSFLVQQGFKPWYGSAYLLPNYSSKTTTIRKLSDKTEWAPYLSIMMVSKFSKLADQTTACQMWCSDDPTVKLTSLKLTLQPIIQNLKKKAINKYQREGYLRKAQTQAVKLFALWQESANNPSSIVDYPQFRISLSQSYQEVVDALIQG